MSPGPHDATPLVEVIIPFRTWDNWVLECAAHFRESTYSRFRLWLVPDAEPSAEWAEKLRALRLPQEVRVLPTGGGNPSVKRNAVLRASDGEVFALIDADAFPSPTWLERGLAALADPVRIVAGPNLTPPEDPLGRRVSGFVMESPLGFGAAYLRHTPVPARTLHEMPTCNMILRRLPDVWFREGLDTAEDMMFCRDMRARGGVLRYEPDVTVYHHRRRIPGPFMRQFFCYGRDKGRLFRVGEGANFWNAAPALLTLYLFVWAAAMALPLPPALKGWSCAPLAAYALLVAFESVRTSRPRLAAVLTAPMFLAAHLSYGIGFLRGYASRR